jgi:NTE family protein
MQFEKLFRSAQVFANQLFAKPTPQPVSRPKLGVAFGGGFARGMAHIGVLKVLAEEGIKIDLVAGTSVGSIIGAGFASGKTVKELSEVAARVRFKHFARWTISRYGFCSNDRMEHFLKSLVPCQTFEELKVPLAVAATDFLSGEPVVFRSGKLMDAIRASCAYPGMFQPVTVNGRMLIDGMLGHAVPTTPLREMGADIVMGIHLAPNWVRDGGPRHVFDVIGQCFSIAQDRLSPAWRKDANIVLEPNVDGFSYDCFDRCQELVKAGEESMRQALPELRRLLGSSAKVAAPAPTPIRVARPSVAPPPQADAA